MPGKKIIKSSVYAILRDWHEDEEHTDPFRSIAEYDDPTKLKILRKASKLCTEGDLRDAIGIQIKATRPPRVQRRRTKYEVTSDRTGKRLLVRARFESDLFSPGDFVDVDPCVIDGTPCIVLRKNLEYADLGADLKRDMQRLDILPEDDEMEEDKAIQDQPASPNHDDAEGPRYV